MRTTHGVLDIPNDPTPWVIVQPNDDNNDDKDWCVLWLQGWNSTVDRHLDRVQRMVKKSEVPFAMLDYAGHGRHPIPIGESTPARQLSEVVGAYDQLKTDGYKNIIAIGGSFGAYMASLLSAERELYAILLCVPAIFDDGDFDKPFKNKPAFTDKQAQRRYYASVTADTDNAALSAIKKFPRSVYVVEHQLDSSVPKNVPKSYFSVAQQGNYHVVPRTDHSPKLMPEPQRHSDYVEILTAFIVQILQLETRLYY